MIWPTESWQVADPSAVGLEPAPLELLLTRIRSGDIRDIHSLLIVKDGYLVVEEYFPGGSREQLHTMQSVSKSITSTLIAAAIQRGLIDSTDDHLLDFFPHTQNITHLDDLKRSITLEHVLRMRLGLAWTELGLPYEDSLNSLHQLNNLDSDLYRFELDSPMAEPPGTSWLYNSGGTILLAGVLEHATGERADEFAEHALFSPIGIDSSCWSILNGVPHTGGGLSMTARDMARIGYLYLNDGVWDGTRLLPEGWVDRATSGQVTATAPGTTPFGYGYLWWLFPGPEDEMAEEADASIYAAWGNMGQFIIVAPRYDLILVTTGGTQNFYDEVMPIEFLYDYVLPAADPALPFVDPGIPDSLDQP